MDIVYRSVGLGFLQFLSGEHAGGIFPINKPTIMIGRAPSNDIVISDRTVSRLHAQLLYKGTYWTIEKLSITNSLFVNSRDVYTAIVNNHDTISMGEETSFLFISSEASQKLTSPYPNPQHHQQNIDSEKFVYYEHRSLYAAPNIDEDTCDEDEEDEEDEEEWEVREHGRFPCSRLGKSEVSRKMRNRVVLVHGSIGRLVHKLGRSQTIDYEPLANNYESPLRKRLRQINYRCEECGNLYPMYAIRVEHAQRRLLCVSCGHNYGILD